MNRLPTAFVAQNGFLACAVTAALALPASAAASVLEPTKWTLTTHVGLKKAQKKRKAKTARHRHAPRRGRVARAHGNSSTSERAGR